MSDTLNAEVTAVIPTRNRLGMLKQAVESALGQDGVSMRVVVVDEGSSDGSTEWLQAHPDERVSFVRHDIPRKLPGARNAGLERTETRWVAFLDDDDIWAPHKIRRQLDACAAAGARWSYSAEVVVDTELEIVDFPVVPSVETLHADLMRRNVVPAGGSSVMIEAQLLREVGGFDEAMVAAEDWECWLRVLAAGHDPAVVDVPSVAYRWGAGSMSMEVDRMRKAHDQVRERHPFSDPVEARAAWDWYQRYLAFQFARHGKVGESVGALRRSGRSYPLRHAILISWVLIARREWPTRVFRRAGNREHQAPTRAWLAPYQSEPVAAAQPVSA